MTETGMMEQEQREKINQQIFKALNPDGCWHETDDAHRATVICRHCRNKFGGSLWEDINPDFTSSLDLMATAEAEIERRGLGVKYVFALNWQMGGAPDTFDLLRASSEIRAICAARVFEEAKEKEKNELES